MALTRSQKQWVIGGSIGAGVLFLGYELLRHKDKNVQLHEKHASLKKHRYAHGDGHENNARGEYGHAKRRRHQRHTHG
jgi:hypothetical protein